MKQGLLVLYAFVLCLTSIPTTDNTSALASMPKNGDQKLINTPGGQMSTVGFAGRVIGIFFLVLLGGLFAGLTLGLMSLDQTNLHILSHSGDEKQKRYANRIIPIRKNGHLLLTTLLLSNTLVNETLPILIDSLAGGSVAAVLISTVLILLFGEIIPQSVCARYGLKIGAIFAWPVRILIWIMFVISYPIAKLLDYVLGEHHGITYRRSELKELVAYHQSGVGGTLSQDEVTIIRGALDLSEKSVVNIMTPLEHVFMVEIDCLLDSLTLRDILRAGNSRIPVYKKDRENVIGLLLAKSLIMVDPNASTPVKDLKLYHLPKVHVSKSIFELLNMFQEGSSHMSLVYRKHQGQDVPVGIVTLEDVVEELIQEEIVDETDVYIDVSNRIKVYRRNTSRFINTINKNLKFDPNSLEDIKSAVKKKGKKREKKIAHLGTDEELKQPKSSSKRILQKSYSQSYMSRSYRPSHSQTHMQSIVSSPSQSIKNKRPGTQSDLKNKEKDYQTFSLPDTP